MQINFMQVLAVGIQIATEIGSAFASYESGGQVTVPPVRTYVGSEHLEIDVTIKHLPPP